MTSSYSVVHKEINQFHNMVKSFIVFSVPTTDIYRHWCHNFTETISMLVNCIDKLFFMRTCKIIFVREFSFQQLRHFSQNALSGF